MNIRMLVALGSLSALLTANAAAQTKIYQANAAPSISTLIADLKGGIAPQTRNAAAYQLAHMGPKAAPAVPALIEALRDPAASVRFPVTIALREIGPAAKAAIPALKKVAEDDINDEVAASAKQAIRHIEPSALPKEDKADKD
jgi:HEAT repeat protein